QSEGISGRRSSDRQQEDAQKPRIQAEMFGFRVCFAANGRTFTASSAIFFVACRLQDAHPGDALQPVSSTCPIKKSLHVRTAALLNRKADQPLGAIFNALKRM